MNRFILLMLFIALSNTIYVKANIVVTNGLTHQFKMEKGQVYKGKIELQNIGIDDKNVKLYLQDASNGANGNVNYTEPGTNPSSNANWIKISTNQLELKSGEKTEVMYEIKVPENITNPGSYSSILMIEPIEHFSPNKAENKGIQINSIIRYAIQLISDYDTQGLKPNLNFESINIENENTERTLNIMLANKGKIYTKAKIFLEIYEFENSTRIEGEFESQLINLLPNITKMFTINISNLKKGKYKAIAFANDENDNIFALEFDFDVE